MENRTSEEIFKEFVKVRDREERLKKNNRGFNLFSSKTLNDDFYISVNKKVKLNILKKEEKIKISSNLPFFHWDYDGWDIEKFFKKFEEFVKIPIFKNLVVYNRLSENKLSYYNITQFNENKIRFEDIKFSFGKVAMKEINLEDFIQKVRDILNKQKEVSEVEEKDFSRYFLLREKIDDLGRKGEKKNYYYSSYGGKSDDTERLSLGEEEVNEKMSKLTSELKELNKKYPFLELPKECEEKEETEEYPYDDEEEEEYLAEEE